jgi:hypothetical protein
MSTKQLLDVAKQEIGVSEQPKGSNRGGKVEEYLDVTGLGGGYPWCAAFVAWCGVKAFGKEWPLPHTADCDGLLAFARKHGILHDKPQAGDVFLCLASKNDATHTGIVVAPNGDGTTVSTIEGNSNSDGSREGFEVATQSHRKIDPSGDRIVKFIHWQDMMQDTGAWHVLLNNVDIGAAEMIGGSNFFVAREFAERLFGKTETDDKLGWDAEARTISWGGKPLGTTATIREDGKAWAPVRGLASAFGLVVEADSATKTIKVHRA